MASARLESSRLVVWVMIHGCTERPWIFILNEICVGFALLLYKLFGRAVGDNANFVDYILLPPFNIIPLFHALGKYHTSRFYFSMLNSHQGEVLSLLGHPVCLCWKLGYSH